MHWNSLYIMSQFVEKYLDTNTSLRILDIGSREVLNSGTYKQYFDKDNWEYVGVDLEAGDNVDLVMPSPYVIPVQDNSFDVIISGQTLEHVKFFWVLLTEVSKKLKSGGLLCIIVPSAGQVHRFPVDCWRFYEDGMRAMAEWMDMEIIEARVDDQSEWMDAILIAKKC